MCITSYMKALHGYGPLDRRLPYIGGGIRGHVDHLTS